MKGSKKQNVLTVLRAEAEKMLSGPKNKLKPQVPERDLDELLHELQVYQVELEMQNDELRIAQTEVEKERTRFSGLFNLAPVGFFMLNKGSIVKDCNDTCAAMIGAGRARLIGRRFQSFVADSEGETLYRFLHEVKVTRQRKSCQLKMVTPSGTMFFAQVEGVAVMNSSSDSMHYYLAVVDITEKRNEEMKKREIANRLEMALRGSSTGTWNVNLNSGRVILDDHAAAIFGLKAGEFNGKYDTLLGHVDAEDRKMLDDVLRTSMNNENQELSVEFKVVHRDGPVRHVEAKGKLAGEPGEDQHLTGIVTDITTRIKLEKEAISLRMNQQKNILKAVLQTQENERKRISSALHDSLGQLLYAAKLNLEQCKEQRDPRASLHKASELLDQAIKETRDISFEIAPSILSDFGVGVAVEEMIKRVSVHGLSITSTITGFTRLDPTVEISIFRILQELVNNIIKHSGAASAAIKLQKKKNNLTIRVSDNGIGFNTVSTAGGTGLSSIKNRLSLFNGSIEIEKRKKGGTEVTVKMLDI